MDFILNGQAHGNVAATLIQNGFSPESLRPFVVPGENGNPDRTFINNNGVAVPVNNAGLLRREDWKVIDSAVIKIAKPRLRAVGDLRSSGLTFNVPNGMAKTVVETAAVSDIDEAQISMDGLREGNNDRPAFSLTNLPLPIIHKDFHYSARQLMASRTGGSPLDTTHAELAARRVAEEAEKLLLGVSSNYDQFSFGGGTIYGYTDHPSRQTKTITAPTATGWTPQTLLTEILDMRKLSQDKNYFGPWMVYVSLAWDQYLDEDWSSSKGDMTVRDRIRKVEGFTDVRTLDYLTGFTILLVQMTSEVVREVVGMDLRTVQWEVKGGMQINFKVMAILVPQIRADYAGQTGIVHGS